MHKQAEILFAHCLKNPPNALELHANDRIIGGRTKPLNER